jgi:putative NADH-flavin reductase
MRIAIFGATGPTGLLTVYQALDKGHEVTAFARKPEMVAMTHKNIRIIQGDIMDYEKVKAAVDGQDAIISALGVSSRKPTTILSEGTRNILRAMEECRVSRFICMSSAGILGNDAGFFFGKIFVPLFLKEVFKDKIRQMEILRGSSVQWVIVRPSALTDSPKTGKYKISMEAPLARTVPRADVADFMLKLITDKQYDGQMPAISS